MRVAPTVVDAVLQWANQKGAAYGTMWPLRVFEGSVDSADVLSTEGEAMRVKAWCADREVPLTDTFGPRAEEVAQLVEGAGRIRWLRPGAGPGVEARVAALVAEHYAALSDYGPVKAPPTRVVRTWHEARDLHATVERRSEAANTAIQAAPVSTGTILELTTQVAQHRLSKVVYDGAWDAAWVEAGRSVATGTKVVPLLEQIAEWDSHYKLMTAMQSSEGMVKALAAAREPARRATWDLVYEVFTQSRLDGPDYEARYAEAVKAGQRAAWRDAPRPIDGPGCTTCVSAPAMRDAILGQFIQHTCITVWQVAMGAAQLAGWQAAHLVHAVPRPDPWRPLLDIWRLGAWPLGPTRSAYLVHLPEPKN